MIHQVMTINSVQKSSKSELSSRFFGRLKILATWRKSSQHGLYGGEGGGTKPYMTEVFGLWWGGGGERKHNSNTPDPKGSVDDGKRFDALGVALTYY